MSMQREMVHRLLDEALDLLGRAGETGQLAEARRHFLLAKREFLLGALALVDHALQTPATPAKDDAGRKSKAIPVED